jgi:two-component system response regulator MprA
MRNQEKGLSILVVEDEIAFADFLHRGLSYEGYKVTISKNAEEGWDILMTDNPDLVILDVGLPDMDGMSLCRSLRLEGRQMPILMLTARIDVSDRVAGLDAGADDYLPKPFAFDELVARIRALLRRTGGDVEKLCFSDLILYSRAREISRRDKTISLTPKEYELLNYFLCYPRQIHTREAILSHVWGFDNEPESNVLEVYIRRLRQKLGPPNLIETAHGVGYILREQGGS